MTIEMFGRPMIERFLREQQLAFLIDQDGDYHVRFAANDGLPELIAQLSARGPGVQRACYDSIGLCDVHAPRTRSVRQRLAPDHALAQGVYLDRRALRRAIHRRQQLVTRRRHSLATIRDPNGQRLVDSV